MATRVCPNCGSQYVASVRRCIDCDLTLVDAPAPAGSSTGTDPDPADASTDGGGTGETATGPTAAAVGAGDQLAYELEGWGSQLKVTLEGMLDRAGVVRVWEAGALVIPAAEEDQVDALIATVEGGEPVELADDGPQVAFEIEALSADEMTDLDAQLIAAHVAHGWSDDGELLVAEGDADAVAAIIDELLAVDPDAVDDGLATHEALSVLFVAVDKVRKSPGDAKLVRRYEAAVAAIDDVGIPYGMSGGEWADLQAQADQLGSVLDAEVDHDDLEAALAAHRRRTGATAEADPVATADDGDGGEGDDDGDEGAPADAVVDRLGLAHDIADLLRQRLQDLV